MAHHTTERFLIGVCTALQREIYVCVCVCDEHESILLTRRRTDSTNINKMKRCYCRNNRRTTEDTADATIPMPALHIDGCAFFTSLGKSTVCGV